MKLKHKTLNNVTVITTKGSVDFVGGIFETDDKTLVAELKKNKNIVEIKEKPVEEEKENKDE
ncbi:MAG: hypothetical protein ACRDA0_08315 [Cetobacterium sp.]|uniref:hypothetical protein n=1 Tax=Cetobacterium sp. TaxID=2071632 RepID=UPI003F38B007